MATLNNPERGPIELETLVSRLIATGADLSTRVAVKKALKGLIENDEAIDAIYVAIRNRAYKRELAKTPPGERVLFLPACLRNTKKCRAVLSREDGYECKKCGACQIGDIIEKAESLGYGHIHVVPGGSMVHRIIKRKTRSGEVKAG